MSKPADIDMHMGTLTVDAAYPATLWNDWGIVASFDVGNSTQDYEPERRSRCKARAAYAATAINAHDDLLAACKAALSVMEADGYAGIVVHSLRAAIAKAKPTA